MFGDIALYSGLFFAVSATVLFCFARNTPLRKWATAIFYAHALTTAFATGYLLFLLIDHQFQYNYVFAHTSLNLPLGYRITALWAGQEGSLLFWALCGAITGGILLYREKVVSTIACAFLSFGQVFLLLLLVLDSPFKILGCLPSDGTGLNPLLMDPWMAIHPPLIFVGYALLIIPMAYSLATLCCQENRGLLPALPWAIVGWLFLGAGIFIGGVWAYRVLGWGGYWGWDPVENSSLVPWLTTTALIHGILVSRRQRANVLSNHLLAIATYPLIILATVITRSGIMSNYSVHAFARTPLSPWMTGYLILVTALGWLTLLRHQQNVEKQQGTTTFLTMKGLVGVAMSILVILALLILMGTLAPVITNLITSPASVDTSFYWLTIGPLILVILVLLGLLPAAKSSTSSWDKLIAYLWLPVTVSSLSVPLCYSLGVRAPFDLLFLATAVFAGTSNIRAGLSTLGTAKNVGGYLAHFGFCLFMIGVLLSQNHTVSDIVNLIQGEPVAALGYQFTWQSPPDSAGTLTINVHGKRQDVITPNYTVQDPQTRAPGILRRPFYDLYISPIAIIPTFENEIVVAKGGYFGYQDYSLQLIDFITDHDDKTPTEVTAIVNVRLLGEIHQLNPGMRITNSGRQYIGAVLPGQSELKLYLQGLDVDQQLAWFTIGTDYCPGREMLIAEVSKKPMISALIWGAIMILSGTLLSVWRRFSDII